MFLWGGVVGSRKYYFYKSNHLPAQAAI